MKCVLCHKNEATAGLAGLFCDDCVLSSGSLAGACQTAKPSVEERLVVIDEQCQALFQENGAFTPMYPWVFVMVCDKAQQIGHIFTPQKQNKTVHEGIVLATWNEKVVERGTVNKDGIRVTRCEVLRSELEPGDRVLFHHFAGAPPPPPYDVDRFRFVQELGWEEKHVGGIFAKTRIDADVTKPLELLIDMVHDAVPEEGLGYYDTVTASLLKAKIGDRFLVVDREAGSVTLSGS